MCPPTQTHTRTHTYTHLWCFWLLTVFANICSRKSIHRLIIRRRQTTDVDKVAYATHLRRDTSWLRCVASAQGAKQAGTKQMKQIKLVWSFRGVSGFVVYCLCVCVCVLVSAGSEDTVVCRSDCYYCRDKSGPSACCRGSTLTAPFQRQAVFLVL